MLSWYDEPPSWLAACVVGMAKVCDVIVALDGAFLMFPGSLSKPHSPLEQAETILRTAEAAGVSCMVHVPTEPWVGNEMGKRHTHLRIAAAQAEEMKDWVFIVDADEHIVSVPSDFEKRLSETEYDVAEVTLRNGAGIHSMRRLYRVLPNLSCVQTHYTITGIREGKTVVLSGNRDFHSVEPSDALLDLELEHHTAERSDERKLAKSVYDKHRPSVEKPEVIHA